MSVSELKIEIQKKVENLPPNQLNSLLRYLSLLETGTGEEQRRMELFEMVVKDDAEVLKKLAQ